MESDYIDKVLDECCASRIGLLDARTGWLVGCFLLQSLAYVLTLVYAHFTAPLLAAKLRFYKYSGIYFNSL